MKFHLIAAALLAVIGLIFFRLLGGMSDEFASNRSKIESETFQTAKKQKPSSEVKAYVNPNLGTKPNPASAAANVASPGRARPVETMVADVMVAPETDNIQGVEYWCRPTEVTIDADPVKCIYRDACYGCEGSTVITPDSNEVLMPYCANGTPAKLFHVECCPQSNGGDGATCPGVMECLRADSVSGTTCACGGKSNCRFVGLKNDGNVDIKCACFD